MSGVIYVGLGVLTYLYLYLIHRRVPGSTIVKGASVFDGMPDAAGSISVSMLRAVVLMGCMLYAAAVEGSRGSKLTVIPLVLSLWVNILYTGNVVE